MSVCTWSWAFSKPTKLIKKRTNDILLTCKAYNGRVVCEWLGACVRQAATVESNVAEDSRLPMCAVAQKLDWDWKMLFLWRTKHYLPHFISDLGNPYGPCPSPGSSLRTHMARLLGLMEQAPRFLTLVLFWWINHVQFFPRLLINILGKNWTCKFSCGGHMKTYISAFSIGDLVSQP